jgi:hypothetical protein
VRLRVLNLSNAHFECTFGRGCSGVCCRNGRPPVYPDEARRIQQQLGALLPLMRAEAQRLTSARGFMSRRRKSGTTTLRVVAGWCVFFNDGCVLHQLGMTRGDKFQYKPFACATFPLERHQTRGWYVRQKGVFGELWDLPCLDPERTSTPAAATLEEELALVEAVDRECDSPLEGAPTPPKTEPTVNRDAIARPR